MSNDGEDPSHGSIVVPNTAENFDRKYQSFPGAQYFLPSDNPERERLALQHRFLVQVFDDRLIFADVSFSPGTRLLDNGTGSGVWLLDAIDRGAVPPSVILHGLDIESRLFPVDDPRVVSRGNIEFTIGSITQLPQEWSNTFTFIHQRFLTAALQAEEWPKSISEMFRAVEPGGWVQLMETGVYKAGPLTAEHLKTKVQPLFAAKGLLLDCAAHIPTFLRDAGFEDIKVDVRSIPLGAWAGELGIKARDNWIGVFKGGKTPYLNSPLGRGQTEAQFDLGVAAVEKEWDETPGAEMKIHLFCARKPAV